MQVTIKLEEAFTASVAWMVSHFSSPLVIATGVPQLVT